MRRIFAVKTNFSRRNATSLPRILRIFSHWVGSNKQLKKFRNAWITQGILNSIKKCHYLHYRGYIVKKDEASIREYKTYKLKLVRSIEKAKQLEQQKQFQRCSGDSSKTWKTLNDFFNKKIAIIVLI